MSGFHAFRKAQKKSNAASSGGGGRTPWQSYILKMDTGETAGIRVLSPGDEGFFIFKSHGFPQQICTAELPGFDGKCVYCHYNERDKEFRDAYYAKVRTVACVVDFRYFHWDNSGEKTLVHPCADAEPNPKKVRCRHCKSTNAELSARHFGGQKRWELTNDQRDQLAEVHGKLQAVCVAQSDEDDAESVCGQRIDVLGYQCGNPECSELIITERDMETHDISEALEDTYECEECNQENWLEPILVCESGDHEAEPGSIFGKIVEVTCSGRTVKTKSGDRTRKSYNFDRNVAPWSRVEDDLAAFGLSDEEIEKTSKHDDLLKRFAPFRLDPGEYGNEAEYVVAVLEKQVEKINDKVKKERDKISLPDGWGDSDDGGGGKRSTGGRPWQRKRS